MTRLLSVVTKSRVPLILLVSAILFLSSGTLNSQTNTMTIARPDGSKTTVEIRQMDKNERAIYEREKEAKEQRRKAEEKSSIYSDCLRDALRSYKENWNNTCRANGWEDGCTRKTYLDQRPVRQRRIAYILVDIFSETVSK